MGAGLGPGAPLGGCQGRGAPLGAERAPLGSQGAVQVPLVLGDVLPGRPCLRMAAERGYPRPRLEWQ